MNTNYKITSHSLKEYKVLGSYGYPLNDNECWKRLLLFISRVLYKDEPEAARRAEAIFALPLYGSREIEWYVPTEFYGYNPKISSLSDYDPERRRELSSELAGIIENIRERAYRLLCANKQAKKTFDDQRLYLSFIYDEDREYRYGCALSFDDQRDIYVINDQYPVIAGWGLRNLSVNTGKSVFYQTYSSDLDTEKPRDETSDLDLHLDAIDYVPFPTEKKPKTEPNIVYEKNDDISASVKESVSDKAPESETDAAGQTASTALHEEESGETAQTVSAGGNETGNAESPQADSRGDSFGGYRPSGKNDDAFYADESSDNEKDTGSARHGFNGLWLAAAVAVLIILLVLFLWSVFGRQGGSQSFTGSNINLPRSGAKTESPAVKNPAGTELRMPALPDGGVSPAVVDLDGIQLPGSGGALNSADPGILPSGGQDGVKQAVPDPADQKNSAENRPDGALPKEDKTDFGTDGNGDGLQSGKTGTAPVRDKPKPEKDVAGDGVKVVDTDAPKDNYIIDNTTGEKVNYDDVVKNSRAGSNPDDPDIVNLDGGNKPVPCYFADFEIDLSTRADDSRQIIYNYHVSHQSKRRVTFTVKKNGNLIDCGGAGVMNNPDYRVDFALKCSDENAERLPSVSCDFSVPSCRGILPESGLSINMHPSQIAMCPKN